MHNLCCCSYFNLNNVTSLHYMYEMIRGLKKSSKHKLNYLHNVYFFLGGNEISYM